MASNEKRNSKRLVQNLPLRIGFLNRSKWMDVHARNYSAEGICFKSEAPLRPGTGILIRVENWERDGSCPDLHEGLRTITIAEVKWCMERPDETHTAYEIGVNYYPNYY